MSARCLELGGKVLPIAAKAQAVGSRPAFQGRMSPGRAHIERHRDVLERPLETDPRRRGRVFHDRAVMFE